MLSHHIPRIAFTAALALSALAPARAAAPAPDSPPPVVVASIKPLHSIVSAVMAGVAEPKLLLDGAVSPHSFALKPSQMRLLQGADLVVWVGPGIEAPLQRALEVRGDAKPVIQMNALAGLTRLPVRAGGNFEEHAHDHGDKHDDHDDHAKHEKHAHDHDKDHDHAREPEKHDERAHEKGHDHGRDGDDNLDPHTWLDPRNAAALAEAVGQQLIELDPARAEQYRENVTALVAKLGALEEELRQQLSGLLDRPFLVFHDAYQYFENRFGVAARAAVTLDADREIGAKRVSELRALVEREGIRCVFTEPQLRPAVVRVIVKGTGANLGQLDPVGAEDAAGAGFYEVLVRGLAEDLADCLSK